MHVSLRHSGDLLAIQQRIEHESDAEQRDRLRAVLLALRGGQANHIAAQLGRSRRFVQTWVYVYRDHGLDAVRPVVSDSAGRPPFLSPEQRAQLKDLLHPVDPPRNHVYRRSGRQVMTLIQSHFGVAMSLSGVYQMLHACGMSALRPRPRHPKHDPARQEQFALRDAPLFSAG